LKRCAEVKYARDIGRIAQGWVCIPLLTATRVAVS
jgi:hypothetical protein